MYKNVVSTSENFYRYYIVGEYDSLNDAMKNLSKDIETFKRKYPKWWKMIYPTYHATIKE